MSDSAELAWVARQSHWFRVRLYCTGVGRAQVIVGEGVNQNLTPTPMNWNTRLHRGMLETQETLLAVTGWWGRSFILLVHKLRIAILV